jgi:hypothetical protein
MPSTTEAATALKRIIYKAALFGKFCKKDPYLKVQKSPEITDFPGFFVGGELGI